MSEPVVLASKVIEPTAVFAPPVVFAVKASLPTAVLLLAVLLTNALYPTPVQLEPVVIALTA